MDVSQNQKNKFQDLINDRSNGKAKKSRKKDINTSSTYQSCNVYIIDIFFPTFLMSCTYEN